MRMESGLLLGSQLSPTNTPVLRKLGIHKKFDSRSKSTVKCTVERVQATRTDSNATASIAQQSDVLCLSVVTRPESSALADLLEHRWKRCYPF